MTAGVPAAASYATKRALYAANEVRHEAPCCIPGSAGRNSEGGSWVRWLTWIRKVKETRACQESSGRAQAYGREVLRDPRNTVRAELPEVKSPAMQAAIHRKDAWTGAVPCVGITHLLTQPPGCG